MTAQEFADEIYMEMDSLEEHEGEMSMEVAKKMYFSVLKFITELREFINEYKFEDIKEEINFFKNDKPRFLSKLIYYRTIFEIESNLPVGIPPDIAAYYLNELDKVKNYIGSNREFLIYYKSGSSLLDAVYFTRKQPDLWLALNSGYNEQDDFSTVYDYKLSKLLAYENVAAFLLDVVHRQSNPDGASHAITWTGSKASLIELLYAIQSIGACNNGTIDVKQLAGHFENMFKVKLGNFYRTFQEIRIRKISRTTFLDHLKETLIKRMDDSDENPRY